MTTEGTTPTVPPTAPTEPPASSATPATWEAFLEGQTTEVKALYTSHSEGLLNSVKATRDERDTLKQQIKDLAKKVEGEAKAKLEAMTAQLEITERRASFLEEAVKPEIECRNPGAAWTIAKAADLFTKNGQPDWKAIKSAAPELFGKIIANANAGSGTEKLPAAKSDMNAFIRSRGRG